jgi:hypothetical protein
MISGCACAVFLFDRDRVKKDIWGVELFWSGQVFLPGIFPFSAAIYPTKCLSCVFALVLTAYPVSFSLPIIYMHS